MITRRNWLLRCSIIINIAVLVYICSQMMYGDNSLQLPATAYLIQQQQQNGGSLQEEAALRKKLSLDTTNNNNNVIHSSSSNNLSSKLINVNGIGEPVAAAAEQSLPEAVAAETGNNNGNSLLKMIPKMEKHLQQQQDNNNIAQQPPAEFEDVNDNNEDDSRFEVPTEALAAAAANGLNGAAAGQNVVYADVINLAPSSSSSTNATNYADGFLGDRAVEQRINSLIKCYDREYLPETMQRGDFWVLKNYVRADHGALRCFETLTYTTHADYTFLDNLIPLLERWMAPVSIALHAPGTDYAATINSIKYLRECAPEAHLVRQFVTFHIYFSSKHIPKNVLKHDKVLESQYNCSITPPFVNASDSQLYKTQKKMLYPVNVGRNVARDAAMTYFILASDIELYPNPGLVGKFLRMIARNEGPLKSTKPRVFPLPIFEVDESVAVPRDKTELQEQFRNGKAILFHKKLCPSCHGVPKSKEWMLANETDHLDIFHVGKRTGYHLHWEPIYIGTHHDPHYDERLSWEGKSDKMTQGYALCALDYEFQILDNAFLVHKPGIKILKKDPKRAMLASKTNQLIRKIIYPELQVMYGVRKGCAI